MRNATATHRRLLAAVTVIVMTVAGTLAAEEYSPNREPIVMPAGWGWATASDGAEADAGGVPIPRHRRWFNTGGDYEQINLEIQQVAPELDLYILGASGRGRTPIQVLLKYDRCCYSLERPPSYRTLLNERIAAVRAGGEFISARRDLVRSRRHRLHARTADRTPREQHRPAAHNADRNVT